MSLVESVANVIVGYVLAVVTQILIFPVFGLHTTLAQNLTMGRCFYRCLNWPQLRLAAALRGDQDLHNEGSTVAKRAEGTPVTSSI